MRIGFEAKRAFHNATGLGNYSRQIIQDLNDAHPNNEYFLYSPSIDKNENPLFRLLRDHPNNHFKTPSGLIGKLSENLWRRNLGKQAKKDQLDVFHGLSNELPNGFKGSSIKKIVTIHDLIFKRHPEWYKAADRKIYDIKTKQVCKNADQIIAVSMHTKNDLIELYGVDESKIKVVYQACHPRFYDNENIPFRNEIINKYKLDKPFIICVGSLIYRKHPIELIKAFIQSKTCQTHELILVGNGPLKNEIESYILDQNIDQKVRLYTNFPSSDLPPMYQLATCSVYASSYEGFGIPIIESLWSKTPVITSQYSCLKETAGNGALYIDQINEAKLSQAIDHLVNDEIQQNQLAEKGFDHVQQFHNQACVEALWKVYKD